MTINSVGASSVPSQVDNKAVQKTPPPQTNPVEEKSESSSERTSEAKGGTVDTLA